MIYTWPIISLFSLISGACMSEIVSAYPSSGGLYFWSAMLGGPKYGPFASYFTGYFVFWGYAGLVAGTGYAFGQFFVNILITNGILGSVQEFHSRLVIFVSAILSMIFTGHLATYGSKTVDIMGKLGFWFTLIGLLGIVGAVLATSPVHSSFTVLASSWNNDTGFSDSYALLTSVLLATITYTGYDAAANLSEECGNPSIEGPRSIILAISSTFFTGTYHKMF
jgi:amino acid transporter